MKRRTVLGDQELQIMKVVWERRTATVRDVYQDLLTRRHVAYTTVMTMMNILEQKGYLKKRAGDDRAFVYEPAKSQKTVIRAMVREFLERVFNGSATPLLVHLVEDSQIAPEDLAELRRTIRKKP
jgi:BlaI family transcriptional regulator, penicillinase repressor